MSETPRIESFPHVVRDTIRYADTDRQGHVNNAVFATFLETGRVTILYDARARPAGEGREFVIARLELAFLAELRWPGEVVIGTRVDGLGRSSVRLDQALFQDGACAARALTTIVLIDGLTRRATPLGDAARAWLSRFATPGAGDAASAP